MDGMDRQCLRSGPFFTLIVEAGERWKTDVWAGPSQASAICSGLVPILPDPAIAP